LRKPGADELDLGVAILLVFAVSDATIQMTNTGDSAKLLDTSWEAVKKYLTHGLLVLQKAEDLKKSILNGDYRKCKHY
jgi:hypothetical protein